MKTLFFCLLILLNHVLSAQLSLPINMGVSPSQVITTVTIDNTLNSNTLTNYQVRLNLTSGNFNFSRSNTAGDDLIFYDSDNSTLLNFYIESFNKAGQTGVIWIKVPSIPASSSKTIYLHYGNAIHALSNGINTFDCFDDFTGISGIASSPNASSPIITGVGGGYLGESLVYDSATNKFWTIFEDRSLATRNITMASASIITGPWTVEASPVIADGTSLTSPCLLRAGAFWYIYYGKGSPNQIWVQKSSTINSGYSTTGISNPILTVGGSGAWDEGRVLEPFVFKEGATFYLFYMAESVGTLFEKTGFATSSNPISGWVKSPLNPVMVNQAPYTWNGGQDQCADPFVIKIGSVFYIGTTGCVTGKGGWTIGFYTTTDFVTFTPQPNAWPNLTNAGLNHGSSWDNNAVLRGSVLKVGNIYYQLYTGFNGTTYSIGLTTMNLSGLEVSPVWVQTGNAIISSGAVTINSGNITHMQKFGQGYAFRSNVKYPSSTLTFTGFRNSGASDLCEWLINSPTGTIKPVTHLTLDNIGTTMGSPGSYMITDMRRNANTDVRFSINDGSDQILNTQIPSSNLSPMFNNPIQVDWMFVRKYNSPEPVVTIP